MVKNIAIDYDDTYTLHPEMFNSIIKIFKNSGFKVYIVTYRHSTSFYDMDLEIEHIEDYIFTNGNAKQKYCDDIGLEISIWVDDSPEAIIYDYHNLPIK